MDASTIILIVTMAGGIVYTTGMYLYRKATAGEKFNLQKYAETFGYCALVSVAAFFTTNAIPDFNAILTQLSSNLPDATTVMSLVSAVILGVFHQTLKTTPATTTPAPATTTPAPATSAAASAPVAAVPAAATTPEPVTPVQESWIANANGTVTNSRTGRTYVNVAVGTADELALQKEDNTTPSHTVTTPNGKTFSTKFAQYWEDPNYQISLYGIPTPAIIAAYTDAVYAYNVVQYNSGKTATAPAAPTVTA
jgi:hypothetical protein